MKIIVQVLIAFLLTLSACSLKPNLSLTQSSLSLKLNQTSFLMTVGVSASINPVVTGTAAVFTVSPALPTGLILNPVTAQIAGTPTVSAALTSYTLTTHDMSGSAVTTSFQLTVYVAPTISVVGSPFTFTQGTLITSITPVISASVYQVSISPTLPAGLTSVTSSGVISGTPTTVSGVTTYTLTASNPAGATATTTISIQVSAASAAIAYAGSPYIFTTGDVLSITPSVSIGTITVSPALANGLSMDTSGHITGTVTGTLAQTTYTMTATNGVTATTTITLQIVAAPVIAYTGSPFTLTKGTVASITPTTLTSVVATSVSPALPGTLAMSATNGNITGTPNAAAANATYTVTATNLAGKTVTTTIAIKINDVAPAITYTGSPFIYTTGAVVSLTPTTQVGTISISPALTNGLTLSSSTGVISGTATTTLATTSYTVTATNTTGQTATATISIQIVAPPAISYAGSPYVVNTGDVVSISPATSVGLITISPAMTNSLSISGTGTISGTASGAITSTTYTITATNAAGATAHTTIVIGPNNPIQMVQTTTQASDSLTITLPGPSTAGNLMVLTIALEDDVANYAGSVSATDNFGNNYVLATGTNSDYVYTGILYAKNINVTSNTPITITLNVASAPNGDDSDAELTATEFSGVDTANPLDQVVNQTYLSTNFPATFATGTTSSTTKAYELVISTVSEDGNIQLAKFTQILHPQGTVLASNNYDSVVSAGETDYAIVSSIGTYSTSWSMTSSSANVGANAAVGAIATFKGTQTASGLSAATKLAFTSSGQSLSTHQCSTLASVASQTAGGQAANVTADQTVALSGTGLDFYSDSNCTLPISSLTFTSSASTTQSFYYAATTPGTIAIHLTPSTFSTVNQNQTISLSSMTWLGTAGDGLWSNGANWSGGLSPNTYNFVYFDSNCTSCNATMDTVNSYLNVNTYPSYTGTITNSATNPTLLNLTLKGGTFNAGTGTLIVEGGFYYSPTATFNAQTGTVQLGDNGANSAYLSSTGGTLTFHHLHFQDAGTQAWAYIVVGGNFYVSGNLTIDNATSTASNNLKIDQQYDAAYGNIYVAGDLTANTGGGGNANLILNGNNNTQTLTGAVAGVLPTLQIAHTGTGGVNLVGTIILDQSFTQTSGTVNPGTSTVQFGRGDSNYDNAGANVTVTTMNFYNLVVNKQNLSGDVNFGDGTYNIANNFTVSSLNGIVNYFFQNTTPPVFNLTGNLSLNSGNISNYAQGTFNFVGTQAQTISSTGGFFNPGYINVNKTGGSLSLSSDVSVNDPGGSESFFEIKQGTFSLAGQALTNAYRFKLDSGTTLNCNGGCGGTVGLPSPPAMLPNACGLGAGKLTCTLLDNGNGGVINP